MSADNYMIIYARPDGLFSGHMIFDSEELNDSEAVKKQPLWVVDTLEEARAKCSEEFLEYGYHIYMEPGDTAGKLRMAVAELNSAANRVLKILAEMNA